MESLNCLSFVDIVDLTADSRENDKNLLPSFLKTITMFRIKCWWNTREDEIKHTKVSFLYDVVIVGGGNDGCGFLDTTYQ